MPLLIMATGVFRPMPGFHAAIGAIIYLAEGFYSYKKRIAAKPEMIQRIIDQLILHRHRILLPHTLQIALAGRLHVRVHPAGA